MLRKALNEVEDPEERKAIAAIDRRMSKLWLLITASGVSFFTAATCHKKTNQQSMKLADSIILRALQWFTLFAADLNHHGDIQAHS